MIKFRVQGSNEFEQLHCIAIKQCSRGSAEQRCAEISALKLV